MFQKKIVFLLLFLLSSCGYEAIHSKKNMIKYNFSITSINFIGNRAINLKVKEKLNKYMIEEKINNHMLDKKDKSFTLKISSTSERVITAKNTAGDTTSFQNTIALNVDVSIDNEFKNSFVITENFNYNNTADKFDLKRYEREIKNNLAISATNRLIFKLSNIQ